MPIIDLSDEQQALVRTARRFAEAEIAPRAAACDASGQFPMEVFDKALEVGLVNMNITEEYGGPGLGLLEEVLVAEELGAGCAGISASLFLNSLPALGILRAGTEAQRRKYLTAMMEDGRKGSYCLTEPSAGSDVLGIETRAARDGDEYVLAGTKQFITNASFADFHLVFAATDPKRHPRRLSAFLVEADRPGVRVGRKLDKLGQRASDTAEVVLEDVRIPATNRLGEEGDGFDLAMYVFDRSRPVIASIGVGTARAAFEHARAYALERQSFGKPLIAHQAIGFLLADMITGIEAARLLVRQAAVRVTSGVRAAREAAMAKAFAAETVMRVTTDAVQVFGGYGYSREYPVEKLLRDAKVFEIYEGTTQVQKLIIAREISR